MRHVESLVLGILDFSCHPLSYNLACGWSFMCAFTFLFVFIYLKEIELILFDSLLGRITTPGVLL